MKLEDNNYYNNKNKYKSKEELMQLDNNKLS